ncbi:MAG: ATP-binding protein [Rhodopila sp.]
MAGTLSDRVAELLRQQDILAQFGERALRSNDLDDILTEACRLVGEALDTDLAKVMDLQDDGLTLKVRAGVGWPPGVVGEATASAEPGSSEGHALETGSPAISPDIAAETRFEYPDFIKAAGVRALVNVVIIGAKGRPPYGLLQVDSRKPRQFTEDDTKFLRSYANLIAAAVDRLRVVKELETERNHLHESMNRQSAALETGLIGFFEWDVPAGTITADRCFASIYGLDPDANATRVKLTDLFALIHPDDRADVEANVAHALASLSGYMKEFRLVHPNGDIRWLLVRGHCYQAEHGRPLHYTGTVVDVTASKQAEQALRRSNEELEANVAERTRELTEANARLRAEAEERERVEDALRQSHKMEAVGQLTSGLAHDFNNLLTAVSGSLELLNMRVDQGRLTDLRRYISTAQEATRRGAALTHRLLAFSRRQTLEPKPTNINRLVDGLADLIRRTVGPGVILEVEALPALWTTLIDPNQLESALLNLCINARDAMPDGGRLTIRTANTALGRLAARRLGLTPGPYVSLSITDTGTGMSSDILEHAFEPFFTTKPLGQGTGLGLSMIYGFVQQSGGQVQISSEVGAGTTVCLYLPRHLGHEDVAEAPAEPAGTQRAAQDETVLVVDDEVSIRSLVTEVLRDLSYTTMEAVDGAAALQLLRSNLRIDLLVTDVGLPGLNGRQVADAARQMRPELRVLFITGYAESMVLGQEQLGQGMHILTKPFTIPALVDLIKALLGQS